MMSVLERFLAVGHLFALDVEISPSTTKMLNVGLLSIIFKDLKPLL